MGKINLHFLLFQSTEAYGLVSKDLEEVSSQAICVFGSTATNIKHTLEVSDETTDFVFCHLLH